MKDPTELYDDLVKDATEKYGLVIEKKTTKWYWRVAGFLVTLLTFGKVDFMNHFYSTFGNRVGVTPSWDNIYTGAKYEMLLHEVEHMKQYKAAGFGNIWLGFFVAGFGYLFLPLPIGLSWVRAKMEMGGYAQSIRAIIQVYGVNAARADKVRIVHHFTSINYLFMWPFKKYMNKWVDDTIERIAAEEGV